MNASLCLALSLLLSSTYQSTQAETQESATPRKSAQASNDSTPFFKVNDKNGDGKLSKEEFPERARRLFERIDRNRDGFVDAEEDTAFRQSRRPVRELVAPKGVNSLRDVEYARVGDKKLLLDLYIPEKAEGQLPCIVWIHGGGWRSGNKSNCPARRFATRGYVVASVAYRLSQEATFPAQIEDCKAALRWLRANAAEFHIDPDRIGAWGSSAGGHLVALLGTSGDVPELEGSLGHPDQSSRVQAVCDFFGPTNFLQMDAHALRGSRLIHDAADSPESQLIGGPIQDHKEKVARANPVTYATEDDPPFLIVHGDRDALVPWHQSELLFDALQAAGLKNIAFHKIEGAGHGFGGRREVDQLVDEFFEKHLKGLKKSSSQE